MINKHPQPVDDCPCFEDSIAFVSSVLGVLLGEWHTVQFGLLPNKNSSGSGEWNNWSISLGFAALKLFFGDHFWRIVAHLSTNSYVLLQAFLLSSSGVLLLRLCFTLFSPQHSALQRSFLHCRIVAFTHPPRITSASLAKEDYTLFPV